MIKTILVPTSGSRSDDSVFATALAVARPLDAHLEFYHLRLTVYEAAVRAPHVQFCRGRAMTDALEHLRAQDEQLSANAVKHFEAFCSASKVAVQATPTTREEISANWSEETDQPEMNLMFHARHSDLVVLGRARNVDLMPNNLIEMLLVGCGRPIVIAPDSPPTSVTGTIEWVGRRLPKRPVPWLQRYRCSDELKESSWSASRKAVPPPLRRSITSCGSSPGTASPRKRASAATNQSRWRRSCCKPLRTCTPTCWWSAASGTRRCARSCSAASLRRSLSTPSCPCLFCTKTHTLAA